METSDAKKVGGYLKEKAIIALTRVTENEVDRAIIKVTSHKLKPPNEKHLKRLVAATFASRPEYDPRTPPKDIVKQLEGRLHSHKWIVALKTLVTLHTLLKQGSGEMVLAMARHSGLFHVSHLKDFTDIEAGSHPAFIQRYARYLEERCMAVLHMGCKQKIEKSEELKKEIEELPFSSALRATEVCCSLHYQCVSCIPYFETGGPMNMQCE
ncbi:putative clathrin assembly protein [Diplonema papillatum]|nr:putative clathrin assembly protein [Diplonema papillatum]